MAKRKLVEIARALGIGAWVPSSAQVRLAQDRTEDLVSYFRHASVHMTENRYQRAIETLARSCYLQGAMDAAQVAAQLTAGKSKT